MAVQRQVLLCVSLLCAGLLCAEALLNAASDDPQDYLLFRRDPPGCDPNTNCMYFVGLRANRANDSYLDVYLSGVADGWVAIGFSETPNMQSSDVVGCSVETATGVVLAVDTYNIVGARSNELDESGTMQSDIVRTSGSFENGRITCSFSRLIVGQDDPPSDFNLDSDYYFLYGDGNVGRGSPDPERFPRHEVTPDISDQIFNPVQDIGEITPDGLMSLVTPPTRAPADYRLRYHDPINCDPESCDYFMGIDTNDGSPLHLDFYLTAATEGWVAVGFSETADMFDADVVGCILDSNNMVNAIDTYNELENIRNNLPDTTSNLILHDSSSTGTRITCIFTRLTEGEDDPPQDRDLNGDYFLLYGVGNIGGEDSFPNHLPLVPAISDGALNPATSISPTTPIRAPADYRLRYHDPEGCNPESCDYFMGIDTNEGNSSYLDFYLTAEIEGWVAVGFTDTPNMFDADVVGCILDSNNMVNAIDTYNAVSERNNLPDTTSNLILHSSSSTGTRITCSFTRLTEGEDDPPQDRDLNEDYFLLYGVGDREGSNSFPTHVPLDPVISAGMNPSTTVTVGAPITAPTRAPADYRLRYYDPEGCDPESCDYFMGIDTNEGNSSFLNFYLTAETEGWVAVGFSETASMLDADVVGCILDNDMVNAIDTYNAVTGRNNLADDNSNLILHSSSSTGTRITCSFSRLIEGEDDPPQDRDLNGDYFLLYGVGNTGGEDSFPTHGLLLVPTISDDTLNPSMDVTMAGGKAVVLPSIITICIVYSLTLLS